MTTPAMPPKPDQPSLRDRVLTGAIWMFTMRWLVRLLSVVSVVVLARLLDKDDFGLAAMASAVVALPTVLLELGMEQAIIREKEPTAGHYNTAWTIRVIQMALIGVCIYAAAPWAANYYDDPRIVDILQVLAVAIFVRGLENFWTVSFRKQMNFRRDFTYEVACKVFGVIAGIVLAYQLRTYWALIYGQFAAHGIRVLLSLAVAPHLPRPTLSHWRLIWAFSQWSLVNGLARYVVLNADKLILGRILSTEAVGIYTIGREIAELPLSEISGPANRVFAPGFAEIQEQRNRLAWALGKAVNAMATIAFPIAIGLSLTAHEVVIVMLGEKWQETGPVLQLLALATLPLTVRGVMANVLVVLGYIRFATITAWARALIFLALAIPATIYGGAIGMAIAFGLSECVATVMSSILYRYLVPEFRLGMQIRAVARPAIAVVAMTLAVLAAEASGVTQPHLLLAIKIAVGAASYVGALALLWLRAGRPDGLEKIALQRIGLHRWSGSV